MARNNLDDPDYFKQKPSDSNEVTNTSMGHSSGTQQIYPGGRKPTNQRLGAATRPIVARPNNQVNLGALQNDVVLFGLRLKMYHLAIAAAVALYFFGLPGVLGIAVIYWISASFQQPAALPQENASAGGNDDGEFTFRPVNRGATQSQSDQPTPAPTNNTPSKFPGTGHRLS